MSRPKVEPPTIEQTQAWLAELRDEHKEQTQEVRRRKSALVDAEQSLSYIERDIKAAEAILKVLSDAGHR